MIDVDRATAGLVAARTTHGRGTEAWIGIDVCNLNIVFPEPPGPSNANGMHSHILETAQVSDADDPLLIIRPL